MLSLSLINLKKKVLLYNWSIYVYSYHNMIRVKYMASELRGI